MCCPRKTFKKKAYLVLPGVQGGQGFQVVQVVQTETLLLYPCLLSPLAPPSGLSLPVPLQNVGLEHMTQGRAWRRVMVQPASD